jgi:hypothetical protein
MKTIVLPDNGDVGMEDSARTRRIRRAEEAPGSLERRMGRPDTPGARARAPVTEPNPPGGRTC